MAGCLDDADPARPDGDADGIDNPETPDNGETPEEELPEAPACPKPAPLETAACPFAPGDRCPGHSGMATIPGTCQCVDMWENVVSLKPDCNPPYLGQQQDNYVGYNHSLPDFAGCCGDDFHRHCMDEDIAEQGVHYACSLPEEPPSAYISWFQARRACENAGKTLCESSLWSQACKAGKEAWYPYGQVFEPCWCQTYVSQGYAQSPDDATVGAAGGDGTCISPAGAFDMSGNVGEWAYEGTASYENAVVLGGDILSLPYPGVGCYPWPANVSIPTSEPRTQGFRCCLEFAPDPEQTQQPEPAAVSYNGEGAPCIDTGVTEEPRDMQAFGDTLALSLYGTDDRTMAFYTDGQRDELVLPRNATHITVSGHRSLLYVQENTLLMIIGGLTAVEVALPQGVAITADDPTACGFAALGSDEYLFVNQKGYSARITPQGVTELTGAIAGTLSGIRHLAVNDADNWLALDSQRMLLCRDGVVHLQENPFDFSLGKLVGDGHDYLAIINGSDTRVFGIDADSGDGGERFYFSTCGFDSITDLAAFGGRLYVTTDLTRLLSLPLETQSENAAQLRHFVPAIPYGVTLPVLGQFTPALHLAAGNTLHVLASETTAEGPPLCAIGE